MSQPKTLCLLPRKSPLLLPSSYLANNSYISQPTPYDPPPRTHQPAHLPSALHLPFPTSATATIRSFFLLTQTTQLASR